MLLDDATKDKEKYGQKGYRPSQADEKAWARIATKAEQRRKLTEEIWKLALGYLSEGWGVLTRQSVPF